MLKGKNIDFSYSKDKTFIKNLNIDIPKGKVTTILGPNGSGKSTLLSILSCFNKPQKGDIYLDDIKLNKLKYKEIAKHIACVHQHNSAPEDIDVETLVSYGRSPYKKNSKEDKRLIDFAIKATNLSEIRHKKVMDLSGGQRQRAFIAMSLAQNTEVLLLDEPTKYSHNIVIMKNGAIVNEGSPSKIINENIIKDVYQVEGFIGKDEDEIYFIPRKVC